LLTAAIMAMLDLIALLGITEILVIVRYSSIK
jgi:hypothetical protein